MDCTRTVAPRRAWRRVWLHTDRTGSQKQARHALARSQERGAFHLEGYLYQAGQLCVQRSGERGAWSGERGADLAARRARHTIATGKAICMTSLPYKVDPDSRAPPVCRFVMRNGQIQMLSNGRIQTGHRAVLRVPAHLWHSLHVAATAATPSRSAAIRPSPRQRSTRFHLLPSTERTFLYLAIYPP